MTKTLIGIGVVFVLGLVIALALFSSNPDRPEIKDTFQPEVVEESKSNDPSIDKAKLFESPKKLDVDQEPVDEINEVTDLQEDVMENGGARDIKQALESMRASVENDDPRTPEMSQPYQRELPTEEELANPALYEAYELRQTKKMASMFNSVNKEIPVIKNRIEAAKLSGSKSAEEIQEAEEALGKMEELSQMLQMSDPDLQQILEDEIPESDTSREYE